MRLQRVSAIAATLFAMAVSVAAAATPAQAAPGDMTIRHAINGNCVEVNSVNIRMYSCGRDPRQRWAMYDREDGWFALYNRGGAGCLTHIWGHIEAQNQECLVEDQRQWWRWQAEPFGYYSLVNRGGACLSMRTNSADDKVPVRVFDCDGNILQLFRPVPD